MALTPEEVAVYKTRLQEAEEAYHSLTIGGSARVFVDQNGERVEFVSARSAQLKAYIADLRIKLGLDLGVTGPMKVWAL